MTLAPVRPELTTDALAVFATTVTEVVQVPTTFRSIDRAALADSLISLISEYRYGFDLCGIRYDDELHPDQVRKLIAGKLDDLAEDIDCEWAGMTRADSARDILEDAAKELVGKARAAGVAHSEEWTAAALLEELAEDMDSEWSCMEAIYERDTSDPVAELAAHSRPVVALVEFSAEVDAAAWEAAYQAHDADTAEDEDAAAVRFGLALGLTADQAAAAAYELRCALSCMVTSGRSPSLAVQLDPADLARVGMARHRLTDAGKRDRIAGSVLEVNGWAYDLPAPVLADTADGFDMPSDFYGAADARAAFVDAEAEAVLFAA